MFKDIKVGDYVLISNGISSRLIRKVVKEVKKSIFKCENDLYTYNISNGKAWNMSYRYASPYDEEKWNSYIKAKEDKDRRNKVINAINAFQCNTHNYTTETLEEIVRFINEHSTMV